MTRAYIVLLAVALGVALALTALTRLPRHPNTAPESPAAAAGPVQVVNLVIAGGAVAPDVVSVPKDTRVRLSVCNRGTTPVRFAVAGYESRVRLEAIAPGATAHAGFTADLPGEDFALLVDARPAGRFAVTGSHLVEGHR